MSRNRPQPLSYQQQQSSCWITSVLNGLVLLFRNAGHIPNEIARVLYSISSRDGTACKEADVAIPFLNASLPQFSASIVRSDAITPELLIRNLKANRPIVVDTLSGNHAVLLTGYEDGYFRMFDPDWKNIVSGLRNAKPCFRVSINPDYNVEVHPEELFRDKCFRSSRFAMGAPSLRYAVVMGRRRKR